MNLYFGGVREIFCKVAEQTKSYYLSCRFAARAFSGWKHQNSINLEWNFKCCLVW
jgi:hypothetical protein